MGGVRRAALLGTDTGEIDRRDPQSLSLLFSPGDEKYSLTKADLDRYQYATAKWLKQGVALEELTSYAGRRNREPQYALTPEKERAGAALIVDLTFPDVAIVGWTNGAVKVMTRKDLGLGPDDPLVTSDDSKSPLLEAMFDG